MGKIVIMKPGEAPVEEGCEELSLERAQALVGGTVQIVYVTYDGVGETPMLIDEDAKLKCWTERDINIAATNLLHAAGGGLHDRIIGTAVLLIDVEF